MFSEQFFPFGFTLILVIALAALALVHKHLRDRNRLRLREMIHQERIAAMQSNQPVPEIPIAELDEPTGGHLSMPTFEQSVRWVRLTALGLGLFGVTTGIGMMIGFSMVGDGELNRMWAIGFLPLFGGLGLVLFHLLTGHEARR